MAKYQHILFDLDGTLTDPKEGITKCFQYALKHMGIIEESLDNLERVIGPPLMDSFQHFYGLSEAQAREAVVKYRERFSTIGLYENKVFDGMEAMLKNLNSHGITLAVASSKPTIYVEQICTHFEIKPYFHHIVGSFLDGRRTQKEEVVAEALRQFHCVQASDNIVMVGDRKFDIEGAHAQGLKAIGVTFGYGSLKELSTAGADKIVDSVSELEQYLLSDF